MLNSGIKGMYTVKVWFLNLMISGLSESLFSLILPAVGFETIGCFSLLPNQGYILCIFFVNLQVLIPLCEPTFRKLIFWTTRGKTPWKGKRTGEPQRCCRWPKVTSWQSRSQLSLTLLFASLKRMVFKLGSVQPPKEEAGGYYKQVQHYYWKSGKRQGEVEAWNILSAIFRIWLFFFKYWKDTIAKRDENGFFGLLQGAMPALTGGVHTERDFNSRSQNGGSVSQMATLSKMIHWTDEWPMSWYLGSKSEN